MNQIISVCPLLVPFIVATNVHSIIYGLFDFESWSAVCECHFCYTTGFLTTFRGQIDNLYRVYNRRKRTDEGKDYFHTGKRKQKKATVYDPFIFSSMNIHEYKILFVCAYSRLLKRYIHLCDIKWI